MKSLNRFITEQRDINQYNIDKIWGAVEKDGYKIHDAFVDFVKDYYSPKDDELAYKIEDDINAYLSKMFNELDKKYGNKK